MEVPLQDRLIGVEELAALIAQPADSVRSDAYRNADALPPRVIFPARGKKQPLRWRLSDVQRWLSSLSTVRTSDEIAPDKSQRRGAPTVSERVAAKRLGITVRELRARASGTPA